MDAPGCDQHLMSDIQNSRFWHKYASSFFKLRWKHCLIFPDCEGCGMRFPWRGTRTRGRHREVEVRRAVKRSL